MNEPLKYAGKLDVYRRLKGLTICALAEKVGVTGDRMENLLAGQHEPRAGDIVKIERRLNIQFEEGDFV